MPNAIQAAAPAGKIVFELERFEYDGERLALSGRWFGVRGRRFVRPTLTLLGASERSSRALADLEHKPWAAEDGEPWEAAFPWARESRTAKFELSVTPDIAIQLPSPGAKRAHRRIAALPRADATFTGTPTLTPTWDASEQVQPPAPPRDPELERSESELRTANAKLEAALAELEASRTALSERAQELEALREQLATAQADRDSAAHEATEAIAARNELAAERDQLLAERDRLMAHSDQLQSHHDALASDRAQVITERDHLVIERDKLVTELSQGKGERADLTAKMRQMASERDERLRQMASEHDQTRQGLAQLQSRLDEASVALNTANRQRDEAVAARGAALVMRHAAGTPPHYERPSSWWKTALAVVALIGAVFAILIVAHVL